MKKRKRRIITSRQITTDGSEKEEGKQPGKRTKQAKRYKTVNRGRGVKP